jgi:hypothetical protein
MTVTRRASLKERVSDSSRRKKFHRFMTLARPVSTSTVIDVGVSDGIHGEAAWKASNFFEALYPYPANIVAVGLHEGLAFRRPDIEFRYVQGDGCDLPFPDDSFDFYFSNAVVEHVGDVTRQRRFVSEALRVAPVVFITTPNILFPVEQHTFLPIVHRLPAAPRRRAFVALRRPHGNDVTLLGPRSFRNLFPPRVEVRVQWLGASLIAFAQRGQASQRARGAL